MRVALRVLAAVTLLLSISALKLGIALISEGHFGAPFRTGLFGTATAIVLLVAIVLGPYSAAQLFRLRRHGRASALVVWAVVFAYYLAGYLWYRSGALSTPYVALYVVASGALVALLLSPAARKACAVAPQPGFAAA
jgi:hypothetical protein